MKSILFLATSLLLSLSVHAEVPNVANGQRLFAESRCLECHGVDVFTRKDRQVKDLAGLERRVRQCDVNLSTNWFDDQILDVVAYLNSAYYKFKPTTAIETAQADADASAQTIDKAITEE